MIPCGKHSTPIIFLVCRFNSLLSFINTTVGWINPCLLFSSGPVKIPADARYALSSCIQMVSSNHIHSIVRPSCSLWKSHPAKVVFVRGFNDLPLVRSLQTPGREDIRKRRDRVYEVANTRDFASCDRLSCWIDGTSGAPIAMSAPTALGPVRGILTSDGISVFYHSGVA